MVIGSQLWTDYLQVHLKQDDNLEAWLSTSADQSRSIQPDIERYYLGEILKNIELA